MMYFNQRAYTPRSSAEAEQWGQVLAFRENFPKEGLWWPYKGKGEFERLVRSHLTQFIRQYASQPVQQQIPPVATTPTQPKEPPALSRQPFEPEMILIPAGAFLMGSDPQQDTDAKDDEQPQHRLYLADYYLAKTPVTNAQYAVFVQATGREPDKGWTTSAPARGEQDHPAQVSRYDAQDYCQRLSGVTGREYELPSEAEWEKGARGTDGRLYPWGKQWDATRCNSEENGLDQTTSVYAYPQGASPYGVLDMAGNVWEWTRSLWGRSLEIPDYRYPYQANDGRENLAAEQELRRVLRGGAFLTVHGGVRCAARGRNFSDDRGRDIGFQVVVRLAS